MATITANLSAILIHPSSYVISTENGIYTYNVWIGESGKNAVTVTGENNTFYNCIGISPTGEGFVNHSSTTIAKNNIFKGVTADASSTEDISANTSYNCFPSGSTPANFGSTGNVISAPLWVDEEGEDFTLDTGSPCARTGTNVNLDYDYYLRRVNPDYPSIGIAEWIVTETKTFGFDSYLKKLNIIYNLNLDSYLKRLNITNTLDLDSYLKRLNTIEITNLDARLITVHTISSFLDSYLKNTNIVESIYIDALLIPTATYTINSNNGTYTYDLWVANGNEAALLVTGENNTFYNCIGISNNNVAFINFSTTTVAKNNIFKGVTIDALSFEDISANTSHNCFPAGSTPINFSSTGNILSDPLWVDEEGEDFRLTDNSPCIWTGTDLNLELDFYSRSVHSTTPSIGISEWIITQIEIDALIKKLNIVNSVSIDSRIKKLGNISEFFIDSYLQSLSITKSAFLNAAIRILGINFVSTDALIKGLNQLTSIELDAYIKQLSATLNVNLNSRLVREYFLTLTLDSYIKKLGETSDLDLDAYIQNLEVTITFEFDSYLKSLNNIITVNLNSILSQKPSMIKFRHQIIDRIFSGKNRIRVFSSKSRQ